jgi:hypothetical protein
MTIYTRSWLIAIFVAGSVISGCRSTKVDRAAAKITFQQKRDWTFNNENIHFSNQFGTARLNNVTQENDSTFRLFVGPENSPINPSPWYAFKLWSGRGISNGVSQSVYLKLIYAGARHRYNPKVSLDSRSWTNVSDVKISSDKNEALFKVQLTADTLIVAAQELMGIKHTYRWADSLSRLSFVRKRDIGKSILGRTIEVLNTRATSEKKIVAVMGRLHPPEVTGYIAMMEFVGVIFGDSQLAKDFRSKYEVLVFPMLNPDGVEEGNWRHSAAGVDLNRDWADFKQPETRSVRDYLLTKVKKGAQVEVGLDFHSTYFDVFYTNNDDPANPTHLPGFMKDWLKSYERAIPGFVANVKPSSNGGNVSKGWMGRELKAEAVTYEVGDDTPRDLMKSNAKLFAQKMMELLLEKNKK